VSWRILAGLLALGALIFFCAPKASAQDHWPPGSVAKLDGDDISVEGGAYRATVPGATSLFVSSGNVVTVHAGVALLTLSGGGMVDICGPAKFTVLESGGSFTLALNFGRVRVRLKDATPIRIFTPFIVATPIVIANEDRDFTLGLDVNDVMCVYAAQGAGRLEQQFGGQDLVVPQLGEFLLPGERLSPAAAQSGSCRCTSYQPRENLAASAKPAQMNPPASEPAPAAKQATIAPSNPETPSTQADARSHADAAPAPQPAPSAPLQPPAESPADTKQGFDLPANANQAPPLAPPANRSAPDPPSVQTVWNVILPPLTFSAASPSPPPEPAGQMALAIPETRVQRDWVFSGHVEPVSAVVPKQDAKPGQKPKASPQKKEGFWKKFRRLFSGSQAPENPSASGNSIN